MAAPLSGARSSSSAGLFGVAELDRKFDELGEAFTVPVMRAAVRAGIKPAFEKAQRDIPVGSETHHTFKGRTVAPGFSQRSLRVVTRVSQDRRTFSAALGVRREAFYAVLFTELGTSKMRARPWLRRSARETQNEQQQALGAKMKERIEAVGRK